MGILDRWVENKLEQLGYIKAEDMKPSRPLSLLLGGEAGGLSGSGDKWNISGTLTSEGWERLAIALSWVYSNIRVIAGMISGAKLGVYRREGEGTTEEVDHPFEQVFRKPNPHMAGDFLQQYSTWWEELRGEAYWWIVRDNAGQLSQLWPIPAPRMYPIPDPEQYISWYAYWSDKERQWLKIPRHQVCFFRLPNPFSYHRGMSRITAYRYPLKTDLAAQKWNQETFENEVTLKTIISMSEDLLVPDYERLKAELEEELVKKQLRYLITRGGDVDIEQLSLSPKDMEFLAGRDFTRKEIDRIFGFPGGYWSESATRANIEAAQWGLANHIWPDMKLIAQQITLQVIQPIYGPDYEVQFEDIRPVNRELELDERREYWNAWTVNEVREDQGKDEFPDDEIGLMPYAHFKLGKRPLEQAAALMPGTQAVEEDDGDGEPEPPMPPGEEQEGEAAEEDDRETKADIRRWRSIAVRRFKAGEDPAGYEFESDHIDGARAEGIKAALVDASTIEEVRAAFAAGPFLLRIPYP